MAIFAIFCVAPCITARCSNNIDDSVLPNKSFEPILPTFLGKHAKTGDTFRSHLPLKVTLSGIVSPQKAVLGAFFREYNFFEPFQPDEHPQVLHMVRKL